MKKCLRVPAVQFLAAATWSSSHVLWVRRSARPPHSPTPIPVLTVPGAAGAKAVRRAKRPTSVHKFGVVSPARAPEIGLRNKANFYERTTYTWVGGPSPQFYEEGVFSTFHFFSCQNEPDTRRKRVFYALLMRRLYPDTLLRTRRANSSGNSGNRARFRRAYCVLHSRIYVLARVEFSAGDSRFPAIAIAPCARIALRHEFCSSAMLTPCWRRDSARQSAHTRIRAYARQAIG